MAFSMYMLRCADESLYVGHTDDLGQRMKAHRTGHYGGYTASRSPVRLIFVEPFSTREEAFAAERMVKAWRRSKKLALARREWRVVRALAAIRAPERRGFATQGSATGERLFRSP